MKREIRVRAMTIPDLDRVMEIASRLPRAPHWPREIYEGALNPQRKPVRIALVAEFSDDPTRGNGQVIGFCIAALVPPEAEIETIAVATECQRSGVARCLMELIFVQLKHFLITEVILEVRESNRAARTLYDSLGFTSGGRRRRYYADPEEDALILHRTLP